MIKVVAYNKLAFPGAHFVQRTPDAEVVDKARQVEIGLQAHIYGIPKAPARNSIGSGVDFYPGREVGDQQLCTFENVAVAEGGAGAETNEVACPRSAAAGVVKTRV